MAKQIDKKVISKLEEWAMFHDRQQGVGPPEQIITPYGVYTPWQIVDEVKKNPPTDRGYEFANVFYNMLKPVNRFSPSEIYKDIKDMIATVPIIFDRAVERFKGPKKE